MTISKQKAILFFIGILFILSTGCNPNKNFEVNNNDQVNAFIYAYTSGVISKTDPIRIRFAQAVEY
jgi:hypothetical protein